MSKSERKQKNNGFTMVELIITIAILAILASVITLSIIRYLEKARESIDINNAVLIRDALTAYTFPPDWQGRPMNYTDPETNQSETFMRGWVYVDRTEIRCSDQSTALALIYSGLVSVSAGFEQRLLDNEEESTRWVPNGPDGDFIRFSGIGEYVFRNRMTVKARKSWNTYQLDVYVDDAGELYLGASASNTLRTETHTKDEATAKLFSKNLGLDGSHITPIGEQFKGN